MIATINPMRYLLTHHMMNHKYTRWMVILQEFYLQFNTPKSKKSLILIEFIMDLPKNTQASLLMRSSLMNIYLWCPQMTPSMLISSSFYKLKNLNLSLHLTIKDACASRPLATSYQGMSSIDKASTPSYIDALITIKLRKP